MKENKFPKKKLKKARRGSVHTDGRRCFKSSNNFVIDFMQNGKL